MKTEFRRTNLIDVIFGPIFRSLIRPSRRDVRPIAWKAPISRTERQLPWTMRELHPQVTEIRGSSSTHYRSYSLLFERFRIEIILRGNELDEIRIASRQETLGTRIDHVQKALAHRANREGELLPLIVNFGDLDEFVKENHRALDEYYSHAAGNRGA